MRTIFTCLLLLIYSIGVAQERSKGDPSLQIYKLLTENKLSLPDSISVYAINFQIHIIKNKGKVRVSKINANDDLAFKIFPNYKQLSNISYDRLIVGKSNMILIVPVLIYSTSGNGIKDENGAPLIRMNSTLNAAYALMNPIRYDNLNDSNDALGHIMSRSLSVMQVDITKCTFINPIIIDVTTIYKR